MDKAVCKCKIAYCVTILSGIVIIALNNGKCEFIAMYGDLGVGKTAFIRGFTALLAPRARVKSPTFAIVNEYRGEPLSVFHFDLYRIDSEDELYSMGFYDYLDRRGVCLTEWSEKIEYALPDRYLRVEIVKNSVECVDSREIRITPVGFEVTESL